MVGGSLEGGPELPSEVPTIFFLPTVPSTGTNGVSVPADCTGAVTLASPDNPARRSPSDEVPALEVCPQWGRERALPVWLLRAWLSQWAISRSEQGPSWPLLRCLDLLRGINV